MSGFSNYEQAKILDAVFSAAALPAPANHYIALYTALPTAANASGTEVSGGSYARKLVANNATTWPAATGSSPTTKSVGIVVTHAAPTANWGTIVGWAVYDALTGGNEIAWAPLTTPKVVNSGDAAPSWAIGQLSITQQ